MSQRTFIKPYSIYKPLPKENAGAGFQMQWSSDAKCVFIEMARQKGKKLPTGDKNQFDWENKITFKLGLVDIGHILLVGSKKPSVELFHKSERVIDGDKVERSAVLKLTKQSGDYDNYALRLSKKETVNGKPKGDAVAVQIYIDHHEMQIIGIMLRGAVEKMVGL